MVFVRFAGLLLVLSLAANSQTAPALTFNSVPTGLRPMGMAGFSTTNQAVVSSYAVVANSGDNSLSAFKVGQTPVQQQVLTGIPSPYAVASCGMTILVSSPSDNAVRVLGASSSGTVSVVGRVPTGPQPSAVSCVGDSQGVVSNVGDNSLTVFDRSTLQVLGTVPGIAGAGALGGLTVTKTLAGGYRAWVAGRDADVVTVVDLGSSKVLTRFPLSRPTKVDGSGQYVLIGSAGAGTIAVLDPETLASVPRVLYPAVPNLQDFSVTSFGGVAISTSPDSLWTFDSSTYLTNPRVTGPVANIAGLAAMGFFVNSSTAMVPYTSESFVLATSTSANSLISISSTGQPAPRTFGISNAASFGPFPVSPGALASAFVATGASQSATASSLPLPTSLAGVTLRIGGTQTYTPGSGFSYSAAGSIPAALLFVGPNQINFQVPTELAAGPYVQAQLTLADGSTQLSTLSIGASSPGLFALAQNGLGQGAVLNGDFSQNGSPQVLPGSRAAARGELIHIYATGCGETTPALPSGQPAPAGGVPLARSKIQPIVRIGDSFANIRFSGLAPGFVGLWQIDAIIPQDVTPGPVVGVTIATENLGFGSPRPGLSNTVTIAVQ